MVAIAVRCRADHIMTIFEKTKSTSFSSGTAAVKVFSHLEVVCKLFPLHFETDNRLRKQLTAQLCSFPWKGRAACCLSVSLDRGVLTLGS